MTRTSPSISHLPDLPRPEPQPRPLISAAGWFWIAACTALFAWMHWKFLYATYRFSQDPNWSHVLIVPVISLYYIYLHKQELRDAPKRLCWWALPLVFAGLYSYLFWIFPGRNDMFRGYSTVFTIFFIVLFLLGPRAMVVLWFPVLYLTLAVKISDAIWSRIAEKLQDIASVGATWVLEGLAAVMSFTVARSGNTITMSFMKDGVWVSEPMNVAEACSGLRMLMAFIALGVALAFLFDRTWWQRLIMISLAVPIAVAVNIGRVAALGVISTINAEYAVGDFHLFVGMMMLIPAAGLFLLVGWILDKIVIRDEPADDEPASAPAPAPAAENRPAGTSWPLVLRGLGLGAAMALCSGLMYAMGMNGLSGRPLFEAVPPTASLVLGGLLLAAMVGLLVVATRWTPGRAGVPALTFAAALTCGVLGVAAAGQHSVLAWQQIVIHKEAVPLRHNLIATLPLEKGDYTFLEDQKLPPEIVDELGTEDYLSRTYEDLSVPAGQPGRYVRLHVAYYTGLVDTVPHVPDRCFVVGGAQHKGLHAEVLALDPALVTERENGPGFTAYAQIDPRDQRDTGVGTTVTLPERDIDAVRFTFGPEQTSDTDRHVIYFFAANGKYLASPNAVRAQGFDIRDTHSYYCKVEVMILGETDPDKVVAGTTKLLNTFLPEIMACLPDWEAVQAGQWPEPAAPAP